MRAVFSERVERARKVVGDLATCRGDDYGAFELVTNDHVRLFVIVSAGDESMRWEHVSVSVRGGKRCPTWEEMCWVKSLFWEDEEPVMQLHPRASEYISFHPYCLHLWRPIDAVIPEPPTIAVGPRTTMAALGMVAR